MPPFASEAQRRAFHYLESLGKIPKSTVDEWEEETPDDEKLPERKRRAKVRPEQET